MYLSEEELSSKRTIIICFYFFRGLVISTKMKSTVVIRRDYLHYVKKYNRFEKRHSNVPCHVSPAFRHIKEGDIVIAG